MCVTLHFFDISLRYVHFYFFFQFWNVETAQESISKESGELLARHLQERESLIRVRDDAVNQASSDEEKREIMTRFSLQQDELLRRHEREKEIARQRMEERRAEIDRHRRMVEEQQEQEKRVQDEKDAALRAEEENISMQLKQVSLCFSLCLTYFYIISFLLRLFCLLFYFNLLFVFDSRGRKKKRPVELSPSFNN